MSLHKRFHVLIYWSAGIHQDWFNHLGDVHRDCHNPHQSPHVLEQRRLESTRDFELFSLGLQDLRKRLKNTTAREDAIFALLQCHVLLAETILGTISCPQGMLWDEQRDCFEQMVDLCGAVMRYEVLDSGCSIDSTPAQIVVQRYTPDMGQDARCPLTFDMSVSMLMSHVLLKCRDARTRLKAIRLMEKYPRMEGLWNSSMMSKTARVTDSVERLGASLEEAAARGAMASEIPLTQRVLGFAGRPHAHSRGADLILFQGKRDGKPTFVTVTW